MRCRPTVLSLLVACALAAGAVPAAAQTGDPFSPLPPAQGDPPVVAPTVEDEDEGLASWQQTLLIAGGALFVVGIGVAIARDARRHAPAESGRSGRTAEGFAVLRDPIACKPAVMAENDDWVAMASEYRAISVLPGADSATVWEPEPARVYSWEHAQV